MGRRGEGLCSPGEREESNDSLELFQRVPPEIVCLQCRLNFYNPRENLLTRWFTAEYSAWFDLSLPGLSAMRAVIPLGGTSNHFKTSARFPKSGFDCGWRAAARGIPCSRKAWVEGKPIVGSIVKSIVPS